MPLGEDARVKRKGYRTALARAGRRWWDNAGRAQAAKAMRCSWMRRGRTGVGGPRGVAGNDAEPRHRRHGGWSRRCGLWVTLWQPCQVGAGASQHLCF
jgi:hypothetical protein